MNPPPHAELLTERTAHTPDLPLLCRLIALYEKRGYSVRVGLNSFHLGNYRDAPFAALYSNGRVAGTGGGISLQEIYFLECLSRVYSPKTVLIIGNAFGWSTIAIALAFSRSKIIAIDNVSEGPDAMVGLNLTNAIAAEENLNCSAIVGTSPQDVSMVISDRLAGSVDLAFVDGLHTNDQQTLDYLGIKQQLTDNGVVLFHDVLNWDMVDSFKKIASDWGGPAQVLPRTPSGMGICYRQSLETSVGVVADAFTDRASGIVLR